MQYNPLTVIEKNKGSMCFIDAWSEDNGTWRNLYSNYFGACHGARSISLPTNTSFVYLYFEVSKNYLPEESIETYLEFCNNAGFPNTYEGIAFSPKEIKSYGYNASTDPFKMNLIRLNFNEYVSPVHVGAAIAAIRLASYQNFFTGAKLIVSTAIELKNFAEDRLDELECLLLAHNMYAKSHDNYFHNHALSFEGYYPINKEKLLKVAKNGRTINRLFETNEKFKIQTIHDLLTNKKYEEVLAILKK